MKKLFAAIVFHFAFACACFSCSIVCDYIRAFDESIYFLEGKVIGSDSLRAKNTFGYKGFAYMKIKVLEQYQSPSSLSNHINVIPTSVGSVCETIGWDIDGLKTYYSKGSIITFAVREVNADQATPFFELGVCSPVLKGSLQKLKPYNFEARRKERAIFVNGEKELRGADRSANNKSYWKKKNEYRRLRDHFLTNENGTLIPESLQTYLTLIELKKAKRSSKKFEILQSLIWSVHFRKAEYLELFGLKEKHLALLQEEFRDINELYAIW
ncbi:MAG: hypothetical protein AAGI23_06705 [Bacteroidota bacterium]